jgi:O-antigen ligase
MDTALAHSARDRVARAGEWVLVVGLAATLAWTTLCLGGYLASTMLFASRAVWGLSCLGAILLLLRPRALDWRAAVTLPFLLFALGSVLALAPAPWLAWREWLLWFQSALVFALALHFVRTKAQIWVLVGTLLGLVAVGSAMAVYQRFGDPTWMMLGRVQAEQFWTRSAGMFGIPNSLAGLIGLALPFCLVLLGSRRVSVTGKVALGWLAALLLVALVLTGSRGGWIGTGCALVLWPVLTARTTRGAWTGGLAVAAALGVSLAAVYAASPAARERIDPFLEGKFEGSRPVIWKVGLQLWQEAPLLGTGAGSYNVHFDRLRPVGFRNEPDWTHNDYLNTLSDYGAVGFVLWCGAGALLLGGAWAGIRRTRRRTSGPPTSGFEGWRPRFGLWLGLVAFAVHLAVDFHTKIPALAWWFAVLLAIVLRADGPRPLRPAPGRVLLALGLAPLLAGIAWSAARGDRLYRSEALRFDERRRIDKIAGGEGTLPAVLPRALARFEESVNIDPENGDAWGDLAYGTVLASHLLGSNLAAVGRRAETAARRALALCSVSAEFWSHLGVALDLQARQDAAEPAFRQAVELAPNNPEFHYMLAHHLAARPGRRDEAMAAVATCLALDPSNAQAKSLRDRLAGVRPQ